MNINQKMNLLFYPNKQRTKNNKILLYVRIYIDGMRAEFTTPHLIEAKNWDSKHGKVKPGSQHAIIINTYLDDVRNSLNKLFFLSHASGNITNAKAIRDLYLGVDKAEPVQKTICDAFVLIR